MMGNFFCINVHILLRILLALQQGLLNGLGMRALTSE